MRFFVLLVLLFASWPYRAGAATVTYVAVVDTSALAGSTGSLDFNFEPGPFGARFVTAQVANFSGSGLPSGVATIAGNASGTLPGTVFLDNGTGFNDYFQGFTFGSTLSFEIALIGPVRFVERKRLRQHVRVQHLFGRRRHGSRSYQRYRRWVRHNGRHQPGWFDDSTQLHEPKHGRYTRTAHGDVINYSGDACLDTSE